MSERAERAAIWIITAIGALCRIVALWQPMRYDESVTWAYFVGRPLGTALSSYPFPNNHVFYSLLAKTSSSLAPFQPWALRLPAFIAGVAIVPLTWAVGRRFAGPNVALVGAALAAGSTSLIVYSSNARGYSLVVAFFLVLLLLADRLRSDPRPRLWVAFTVAAALGLYTIPVMLYPLGVVCVWLMLAALRARGEPRRRIVLGTVVASGAAVAVAALLYLPVIRSAGLDALVGNKFVSPSTWRSFFAAMPRHVIETLRAWTAPLPWWGALLAAGVAVLGVRRTEPSERPSLALATALWCLFLLLLTHRAPFVRVWLFLLPLFLLSVARGLLRLASRWPAAAALGSPRGAVAVATVVGVIALAGRTAQATDDTGVFRSARAVTARLAPELRAGDRVLAPIPTNGPLLYYFSERGLDTALLNTPPAATRRAFLVLDPARGRGLDWALRIGMIDPSQYAEPTLLLKLPDVELWRSDKRAAR